MDRSEGQLLCEVFARDAQGDSRSVKVVVKIARLERKLLKVNDKIRILRFIIFDVLYGRILSHLF